MANETERPAHVTGAILEYLDVAQDDATLFGVTNLENVLPWLQEKFGLSRKDASAALVYWMTTFGERHPRGDE